MPSRLSGLAADYVCQLQSEMVQTTPWSSVEFTTSSDESTSHSGILEVLHVCNVITIYTGAYW